MQRCLQEYQCSTVNGGSAAWPHNAIGDLSDISATSLKILMAKEVRMQCLLLGVTLNFKLFWT
jgi:hypothetical protein